MLAGGLGQSKPFQPRPRARPYDGPKLKTVLRYDLKDDDGHLQCPEEECPLTFTAFDDLVKHIHRKCVASQTCVLCPGKPTWTHHETNGKRHVQCHLPALLQCSICGFKTRTDSTLYNHKVSHGIGSRAERKVACDQCDLRFQDIAHLEEHNLKERIHTVAPLVECEACEKLIRRSLLLYTATSGPVRHRISTEPCCMNVQMPQDLHHNRHAPWTSSNRTPAQRRDCQLCHESRLCQHRRHGKVGYRDYAISYSLI